MDPLVSFLVDNYYADDYRSAEKILECISDEFYDELLEALTPEERAAGRAKVAKKKQQRAEFFTSRGATPPSREELQQSIKQGKPATRGQRPQTGTSGLAGKSDSRELTPSATTQTPRSRATNPRNPIRPINPTQSLSAQATKLTGMRAEPARLSSRVPVHLQDPQTNPNWKPIGNTTLRNVSGEQKPRSNAGNQVRNRFMG